MDDRRRFLNGGTVTTVHGNWFAAFPILRIPGRAEMQGVFITHLFWCLMLHFPQAPCEAHVSMR